MNEKIVFISGANRGIGFGMQQVLLARGYTVIVGFRSIPSTHTFLVQESDQRHPVKIDVTDESDCTDLYNWIEARFGRLDYLINNAGILIDQGVALNDLDVTDLSLTFNVNVGGVHLVTKSLYPLLVKGDGKQIFNISSNMGGIGRGQGGSTAYRVSKAALNMLTVNQAVAYQPDGVAAVAVHPGWVQSDMGGSNATLTVEQSATSLIDLLESLTPGQSGQFLNYDGSPLAW